MSGWRVSFVDSCFSPSFFFLFLVLLCLVLLCMYSHGLLLPKLGVDLPPAVCPSRLPSRDSLGLLISLSFLPLPSCPIKHPTNPLLPADRRDRVILEAFLFQSPTVLSRTPLELPFCMQARLHFHALLTRHAVVAATPHQPARQFALLAVAWPTSVTLHKHALSSLPYTA